MIAWKSSAFSKSKRVRILLCIIILFYLLNGIYYLNSQSITSDEGSFMNYAIRLVKGNPERIHPMSDNSKMPVNVLNLAPRAMAQLLNPGLKKYDEGVSDIIAGRYVTLLISLFTILIAFKWSSKLYGSNAGLFSAFLVSFCPNIIANACLVTTDSYSALFLILTLYFLWKFCRTNSYRIFLLFTLTIAFSQLVKQSLFHLYVICPIILAIWYFVNRPQIILKRIILYTGTFLFVNWLVINLGFYFHGINTPLSDFTFCSEVFIKIQHILPAHLIVPLPREFLTGLDLAKYYDQVGGGNDAISSFGNVTILGNYSTGGNFWYYYFISLLFKTPLSILIFIIWSAVVLIRKRKTKDFCDNELFLLFPVVYFLLYMSFLYNTQCGIRQLIFIYPLLYVVCGVLIPGLTVPFLHLKTLLCVFLVLSVLRYWGDYYPYTNELIVDKKMAFSYVGASNLDFNQGNYVFREYFAEHPEVKRISEKPETGVFLIRLNDYLDIWNLHKHDWVNHIRPSGHVAFYGLLIDVKQTDLPLPAR